MTLSMWITLLLTLVMLGRWQMDIAALLMMAVPGFAQFFGKPVLSSIIRGSSIVHRLTF